MIGTKGGAKIGIATASMVSGRGFTPEELAVHAVNEVISIGNSSHPVIQAQAEAFREDIKNVMLNYLRQAVASHNTTLTNRFTDAGHPELVKLLEV
ncbi:MAG: hypothetical protein CL532_01970 [Aestuariivita sp.]|mgnify:FL=1|nr:hypothetical protein [Aestuariivita sp.]|tara:strand:- start:521 stop:808 length:288 start_codon:yes stop_codon:yes gene_type:complete